MEYNIILSCLRVSSKYMLCSGDIQIYRCFLKISQYILMCQANLQANMLKR